MQMIHDDRQVSGGSRTSGLQPPLHDKRMQNLRSNTNRKPFPREEVPGGSFDDEVSV